MIDVDPQAADTSHRSLHKSEDMIERTKTVGFYARGESHWRSVLADSCKGVLGLPTDRIPGWLHRAPVIRSLIREEFRVLSYMLDWKDAFAESASLSVEWYNINNLYEYRCGLKKLKEYPLILVLHSAAWDSMALLRLARNQFRDRCGKLLIFFGNEYDYMKEKIGFARAVSADYIASQLPHNSAVWLYGECKRSQILPAPAALNSNLYRAGLEVRHVDIGFRGDLYGDHALGDRDRSTILKHFDKQAEKYGLVKDIVFTRYPREQWSEFLARCKGIVGAESGTYYLERDGKTRRAVNQYMSLYPHVSFEEVQDRFFRHYEAPVSGKAVSSRHFEPIGTKTCQLLLEGHYNGILKADEHYISIKKDLSNIDEVIRRFKDPGYRQAMVDRAHDYVMREHTYAHRVEQILAMIGLR